MPKKNYKIKTKFEADDKFTSRVNRMSKGIQRLNKIAKLAKRSLRAAGRAVMFVGRQMARAAKVGFVALAGAATAAFVAVQSTAARMDKLAKTARSINFPIEQFQEWRFVAEQSGVQSETFDKSLQKFTRSMGELKGGYGSLFTALKKSDKQLLKQLKNTDDVSDALQIYLRAIGDAKGATEKAALSAAGFGRAGIDMINVANESAESIEKLRAQMRENGVVTAEQARKAEEYNDMQNRLKLTIQSVATDAISLVIPMLTEWTDKLRVLILENRELIKQRVQEIFKRIVNFAKESAKWISENKDNIKSFGKGLLDVGRIFAKAAMFIVENKWAILALVGAMASLQVAMGGLKLMIMAKDAGVAAGAIKGLGAAGLWAGGALAAGLAGGAIGTAISKYIVEPFQQAAYDVTVAAENMATMVSRNLAKMNEAQRKTAEDTLAKQIERRGSTFNKFRAFITGTSQENNAAIQQMKTTLGEVQQASAIARSKKALGFGADDEELQSLSGTARGGGGDMSVFGVSSPQVQATSTTKTEVKRTEVVIKDETGRAEMTRGRQGDGLSLVTTGAM